MKQLLHRLQFVLTNRILTRLALAIVVAGIALRIVVYLQNRSLIGDEANVVRNIYEKSYWQLTGLLNYETFAPPLYLWATKISGAIFGFTEYGMRLWPLISGITALWLLWLVLKRVTTPAAAWYPLLLFASGYIYLRYATEVKQYSSDVAVALALILLALKSDVSRARPASFILFWGLAGLIAVPLSMPSVFILAGCFFYFLHQSIIGDRKKIRVVLSLGAVWAVGFAVYFFLSLQYQVGSPGLQYSHKDFFLFFIPQNSFEWSRNASLTLPLISESAGDTTLAIAFNLLLVLTGGIYLLRKKFGQFLLFVIPLVCMLSAAAMHKFTMVNRVILFIMPVILLLAGIGLGRLFTVKPQVVKIAATAIAIVCVINFNQFQYFFKPLWYEEFKQGLALLQKEKIDGKHFHVNWLITSVYHYYLTIDPNRAQWKDLAGADETTYYVKYDSLARTFTRDAVIYMYYDEYALIEELKIDHKYCRSVSERWIPGGKVYIMEK